MLDIKWWSFKRFKIKSQGGRNWQNWRLELCKCGSAHRLRRYPFRTPPPLFFFTECSHPWRFPGILALRPLPGQPSLSASQQPDRRPNPLHPLPKAARRDRIRRPNRDRAGEQTKAPRHRCSVSAQTKRRPGLTRFVFHLIQYARVFPEGAIPWVDQSPSPPHHTFPALQSNWSPSSDRSLSSIALSSWASVPGPSKGGGNIQHLWTLAAQALPGRRACPHHQDPAILPATQTRSYAPTFAGKILPHGPVVSQSVRLGVSPTP